MFDIEAKSEIPIESMVITSLWVRGSLGNVSVYLCDTEFKDKYSEEECWKVMYRKKHLASFTEYVELPLKSPIKLMRGEKRGIYIHSNTDEHGIIYDDERNKVTFENCFLKVHSGLASICPIPFSPTEEASWTWRWPWRPNREFVGKISFGVKYVLWRPISSVHSSFMPSFRSGVVEFVKVMRSGKLGFKVYRDIVFLVLNFIRFDWFENKDCLKLDDVRRSDGDPIGWGVNWESYQEKILDHRMKYQRRKGILLEQHPPMSVDSEDDYEDYEDEESYSE